VSEVSVIIPTLNEARGIGPIIREINDVLESPEIWVIDANSVDGTQQIASDLGARVVKQVGRGKGRALKQILPFVSATSRHVVVIDGDFTYPAVYIPSMTRILKENGDVGMVTGKRGYRTGWKPKFKERPIYFLTRNFEHNLLLLIHRLFNKIKMEDPLTGFRVLRYECLKDFRPKAKGFDVEVELNNYVRKRGWRIVEVPIKSRSRIETGASRDVGSFRYGRHGQAILLRIILMGIEDIPLMLKILFVDLS